MVLPILLPEISNQEDKDGSMSKLDFKAISNGIIEDGADIIFNRFNVGVKMTPEVARHNLLEGLIKNKAYFHQLEQLSDPENFGVYFEIYETNKNPKMLERSIDRTQKLLTRTLGKNRHEITDMVAGSTFRFDKVPDRYEILNDTKWAAAMLRWNIKEHFRMMLSPDPICKGVIVIDKYIYRDEYDLHGGSIVNYAIATRNDYTELFENISRANDYARFLKMFDTSFIVEDIKALNKSMEARDILSLRGHSTSITYNFKLANNTPVEAYAALAKEFGYKAFGTKYILDPHRELGKGPERLDPDNMPELLSGMRINLEDDRGSNICLSKEPYQTDNYRFTLSDLGCDVSAEFMARFTNEMGKLDATTSRKVDYKAMFSEMKSVYLPGFPMANTNTISLSYPGNLSSLGKD